jgi:serine/threonine protein kinase
MTPDVDLAAGSGPSSGVPERDRQEPPVLRHGEELVPGYVVTELLNRGRDLDVYEVWSESRWCVCVAKTPRPDHRDSTRLAERLTLEGHLLQTLTHPHLVRAYDLVPDPFPVVILETLPGLTLEYLIATRPQRLPSSQLAHLGTHLCSAAHYLHRNGYLHCDLKPSNVISNNGTAKLLDLSLVRPPGPGAAGQGTHIYLAPEQATGGELTAATDVWGIGAVLYEAVSGYAPFEPMDDEEEEWLDADRSHYLQLRRPPRRLRRHRRTMPAAFCDLVEQCLSVDPEQRPQLPELMDRLQELTGEPAGRPTVEAGAGPDPAGLGQPADEPERRGDQPLGGLHVVPGAAALDDAAGQPAVAAAPAEPDGGADR